jgi:peroxiredoxin
MSGRSPDPGAEPPAATTGRRRLLLYVGVGAGFAALGGGLAWRRFSPGPASAEAVALLHEQTLPDPDGRPFDLGTLRGKPLVVNFWATWCAPCVEEMPELSDLHLQLSPKGVHVLGIGIDSPQNVAEFVKRTPVSYPLVVAGLGGSELARRFGNASGALPYTVLIDRGGRVVHRILGRVRIDSLTQQAASMAR